jgi:hypothetical protein
MNGSELIKPEEGDGNPEFATRAHLHRRRAARHARNGLTSLHHLDDFFQNPMSIRRGLVRRLN